MPELPDEVIDDILNRLPVKDLLNFRRVSKQFCALIDSPTFIKSQLNRSLQTLTHLTLISSTDDDDICLVDLDVFDGVVKLGPSVQVDNPIKSKENWTSIEGSCNGLICLYNALHYALFNPSTKNFIILPPFSVHTADDMAFVGLVYDQIGDEFKVFWISAVFHDWEDLAFVTQVMVYGLRSNKWRRVCESFHYYLYLPNDRERHAGVLVNGALHWIASRYQVDIFDAVVGFDGVDEKCWEAKVPSVFKVDYGTLGVLGGCLCLLYAFNERGFIELWVMNEYMVEESWTKVVRMTLPSFPNVEYTEKHGLLCARVLGCSKSWRDGVLLQVCGNLVWYDVKEKRVVDLGIRSFVADVNVRSLVKLDHYR